TIKYTGGTEIDRTYYFYGSVAPSSRAGMGTINKALYASQVQIGTIDKTVLGADANTKSITYYANLIPGEEIANYSYNYQIGVGTVKTTAFYYYNNRNVRAPSAGVNDAMTTSTTYKGQLASEDYTKLQSITYYDTRFGKGDEKADCSINYKPGGIEVRNTTYYYYGSNISPVRAINAGVNDRLIKTETMVDVAKTATNTGIINNAGTSIWTNSGKFGGGLTFDTTYDYVTINNNSTLNPANAITISVWVNPSVIPAGA
ncbi:MAG: hypothetical protein Q8R48_07105, partial [Candidatus Omnitrophota bacterium]|nr:hypothetical protein [Candidatus Omnitrophota bacterium]